MTALPGPGRALRRSSQRDCGRRTWSACLQREGDGEGDPLPLADLGIQLPASFGSEPVVLRLAVVLRCSPRRGKPPGVFHAVECGEERPWLYVERAARDLLDAARNAKPKQFTQGGSLQDHQIQCG